MEANSWKNHRRPEKASYSTEPAAQHTRSPSQERNDKQAARRAAQEYGSRVSQRNRDNLKKNPKKSKTKSKASQSFDLHSKPTSHTQHEDSIKPERRTRSMTSSRVQNWVWECSKLSLAEGTLHAHPNHSSSEEKSAARTGSDCAGHKATQTSNSPGNVRCRRQMINASVQISSPHKSDTLGSSRRRKTSRSSTIKSGREKPDQSDDEEETETVIRKEEALVRTQIQALKNTRNSLLAERRVIRLKIEELHLRREVRTLAREVARARAELIALGSKELKESKEASNEHLENCNMEPTCSTPEKRSLVSNNAAEMEEVQPKKHSLKHSVSTHEADKTKVEAPMFGESQGQETVAPNFGLLGSEANGQSGTDAETISARSHIAEVAKQGESFLSTRTDVSETHIKLSPCLELQSRNVVDSTTIQDHEDGSFSHRTRSTDGSFATRFDVKKATNETDVLNENKGFWSDTLLEVKEYLSSNQDTKSAPVALLEFLRDKDKDPLRKAKTCDESKSLLSGEEEKGKTLKPSLNEAPGQVSFRNKDLQHSGSAREEKDNSSISSSSSALSLCFETEGEGQAFVNRNPADILTEVAQTDKEAFGGSEDERFIDCDVTEDGLSETQMKGKQTPSTAHPLTPLLGQLLPEAHGIESPSSDSSSQKLQNITSTNEGTNQGNPQTLQQSSADPDSSKNTQSDVKGGKQLTSESGSSKQHASGQEALITASSTSSCWVQFSQTEASYIEDLVLRLIRCFCDPTPPDFLLENELPLSLTTFSQIEKQLGNSYVQEAFDRAVFDLINKRLLEIYKCCGRLKTTDSATLTGDEWELPSLRYLVEDVQKTVIKTTDCNADPFASHTCKERIIESLLQQDAKRFRRRHIPIQNPFFGMIHI